MEIKSLLMLNINQYNLFVIYNLTAILVFYWVVYVYF